MLVALVKRNLGHLRIRGVLDLRFDSKGRLHWVDKAGYVFRAAKGSDGSYGVSRLRSPKEEEIRLAGKLLEGRVVLTAFVDAGRGWFGRRIRRGLELVDLESGARTQSPPVFPKAHGVNEVIHWIALSPDGTLLMAVADGNAALVEIPSLKIRKRFDQAWGEGAAFSPDGELAVLGTDGRGLFVWSAKTGELLWHPPFLRRDFLEPLIFVSKRVLYTESFRGLTRVDLKSRSRTLIHATLGASAMLVPKKRPEVIVCGLRSGSVKVYRLPSADRGGR